MIVLIDGDPLIYQAYWPVQVTYKKYLKGLKERLLMGELSQEKYEKKLERAETSFLKRGKVKAIANIDRLIASILEDNFTTEHVIALGGPTNFRKDLYPEYKVSSTRTTVRDNKPPFFDDLHEHIASMETTIVSEGCEADDLIRIWSLECEKENKEFFICSIDKDLDCIPGWHYCNIHPTKGPHSYEVTPEYANWFYWKQALMGDNVDNIPGIWRVGPKKAEAILAEVEPEDYERAVCKAYDKAYGEEGYDTMLLNCRLLHIWRYQDDHFKVPRERYDAFIKD